MGERLTENNMISCVMSKITQIIQILFVFADRRRTKVETVRRSQI